MFVGMIVLLLVLTLPVAGGRVGRLAELRLRGLPVLLATLVVQILITDVLNNGSKPVLAATHVLTYLAAGYVLLLNRHVPGMLLVGTGAALNGIAIAVNGGTLPASARALRHAGIRPEGFSNSGLVAHPKLSFLGDTMSTPSWLPFHNVISVGDLMILLGVAVLLHVTCRSRLGSAVEAVGARVRQLLLSAVHEKLARQISLRRRAVG